MAISRFFFALLGTVLRFFGGGYVIGKQYMADDRAVFIQDRNYLCFINDRIFVRGGIILPVYSFEVVLEFQNDLFAGLYF